MPSTNETTLFHGLEMKARQASRPQVRRFVVNNESYRFKIGAIECIAVSDGTFAYAPDAFVANVPTERFQQELHDHKLPVDQIMRNFTITCPEAANERGRLRLSGSGTKARG